MMHAAGSGSRRVQETDRAQGGLTLPVQRINLSRDRDEPLYQQLYTQIRGLITAEHPFPAGTRLPASRRLAEHLGVSRNTVMLAYQRLREEGYVSGQSGSGTVVQTMRRAVRRETGRRPPEPRRDAAADEAVRPGAAFAVGVPPVDLFPLRLWTHLVSRRLRISGDRVMLGGHGMGEWPLRGAIAAHLNLFRGIPCAPEQVIVTRGLNAGLDLLIKTLLAPGDRVWCEEPGYPCVRRSLSYLGCVPLAVPVDADGLDVTPTAGRPSASMAVVSPARQLPTAVSMSGPRRQRLLTHARRHKMWIVELEYDAAFLDLPAFRPLFADEPDGRVIHLGTFNTTLFPQLHLGYCVLPPALAGTVGTPLAVAAAEVSTTTQEAAADLLEHHRFARSFGRIQSACAQRRALLSSALLAAPGLISAIQGRPDSGSYLTVTLPRRVNERRLVAQGRRESLALAPLSAYFDSPPPEPGLVLGCAGTREDAIIPAVRRLAHLVSRA
jgi:GntR family transcriptional regulator / MocR family aminotransferase